MTHKNPKIAQVLSVLIAFATLSPGFAQSPTPVRTAPVKSELVQEHRRVTGSLQAVSRSAIASQEAGQVLLVEIDEGMTVEQGEVIARLDDRRLRAQLAEAEARVARAQSDLLERQSELSFAEFETKRLEKLQKNQVASDRESRQAEALFNAAKARVEAAIGLIHESQRQVDLLRIRVDDMTVKAPFDARVVRRHIDAGEWIEPGEPIVTLVSIGDIEARLDVPERYSPAVTKYANRIYADVIGLGRTLPSKDVRVIPDVDMQARTFNVIITLDNIEAEVAPGMSVVAWIPTTDEAEHLTVPKSSVVRSGRDAYVYRSTTNGEGATVASKTPVTVLFDWEDRVVVSAADLKAGDDVIIEGNERILPGSQVAAKTTR